MPSILDPRMVVAYPLNEEEAGDTSFSVTTTRHDLTPGNATGSQGVPPADDMRSGRARDLRDIITGLTTSRRYLKGSNAAFSSHPLFIALPRATNSTGYAYGCRFQFKGVHATTVQDMYGMIASGGASRGHWGFVFEDDNVASPNMAGRLQILTSQRTLETISTSGSWTDDDGIVAELGAFYLDQDEWYRAVVRIYNLSGTSYIMQVVLYRESTGKVYRFTRAALTADYVAPTTDVELVIGSTNAAGNSFQGLVDDCWLLTGDLSETQAIDLSIQGVRLPRVEDDTYRAAPRYVTYLKRNTGESRRHIVTSGDLLVKVPYRGRFQRTSVAVVGYAPGRPPVIEHLSIIYIQKGPARKAVR